MDELEGIVCDHEEMSLVDSFIGKLHKLCGEDHVPNITESKKAGWKFVDAIKSPILQRAARSAMVRYCAAHPYKSEGDANDPF